ncbi:MAG: TfoX/Sxy family DNA transformation protein [Pseudomonadota bacterium]
MTSPPDPADPVTTIRNLGPGMAARFAEAGIDTAEEIRTLGADRAYARLLASGHRAHFMAFVALSLGLQDRPWQDLGTREKAALRRRFDSLKAGKIPTADAWDAETEASEASGDALPPALADAVKRFGIGD